MLRNILPVLSLLFLLGCSSSQAYSIEMIIVEGGAFVSSRPQNSNSTAVTIDDFYIAQHEVTVGMWKDFLSFNNRSFEYEMMYLAMSPSDVIHEITDDLPIAGITWFDAILFCNWLSQHSGLDPVYIIPTDFESNDDVARVQWNSTANGYRLPTDFEWEFAASGGNSSSGFLYSGSNNPDEVAWWFGNSDGIFQPVMTKASNELGIYDMSGNAGEWCWDFYDETFFPNDVDNPRGPTQGLSSDFLLYSSPKDLSFLKVVQGGSAGTALSYLSLKESRYCDVPKGFGGIRLIRNAD